MSDRKSQGGSDKPKKSREEVKRKKGHLAMRNNVWTIRMALWKELRPLEMCIVDIIIDKTIGWRSDEAVIKMEEFMESSGQKHPHIYKALKTLDDMGVISRRKHEHRVYYGLKEDYFGGLLIKRHQEALLARRNKVKIVVDNSKSNVDKSGNGTKTVYENSTGNVPNSYKVCTDSVQGLYENGTTKQVQESETIGEKRSLKTFFQDILINTSLQSGESPKAGGDLQSLSGGKKTKTQRTPEEHQRIIKEQLEMMKAGGLA